MIHHLRVLAARLRGLFGDRRADQELDDEIEMHLRLLADRYVRQGMTKREIDLWVPLINPEQIGFMVIGRPYCELHPGAARDEG